MATHTRLWVFQIVSALLLVPLIARPNVAFAQQELESYTHQLTQSTADYQLWTTPPSERVFKDDAVPAQSGSNIKVYAAQNEFEPFQLIVNPSTTGNISISIGDFGAGITSELYQVDYVHVTQTSDGLGRTGEYPDPLWPLEKGATVHLRAGENTAFWFSLHVPKSTPAGNYTSSVQIGKISVPVVLRVFNFAIPDALHVKSQMNVSFNAMLEQYSVPGTGDEYWQYVDAMKQLFIDHRLTPKSPLWPGGVTGNGGAPFIDYDCSSGLFTDPHGIWGFEEPAAKYLSGNGFNDGVGYPSWMALTFRNNDASADQRPDTFCGESRSEADWLPTSDPDSPYNERWFDYVDALQSYLNGLGYLDEAYYYMANEPQDQADYDAVAWYTQELKKAAPNLKLMVSEEPKPEIYAHASYPGAKIDIWLPVLHQYNPTLSHERQRLHGEETWIYFLHGTRPPYFNPITLDHPAIESKLTGWFLWKYRIRGIAYYSLNGWAQNPWSEPMTSGHNGDTFMLYPPAKDNQPIAYGSNNHRFVPSIRFELMRDSLEEYEYLYVLNGGQPQVDEVNDADAQVDKIISGLTSYTRDSQFMYNLRRLIGLKNGGEITSIPNLNPQSSHPRAEGAPGNYYINFQDPAGAPTANPLIVDGKEYLKVGWNEYTADLSLGYGWYGDMAHVKYQYLDNGPDVLQSSIIYDDWGRQKTFEFDLPNGLYDVTVSVGWQGKQYPHNQIEIEGVPFIVDEASDPYLVRRKEVAIADSKLTLTMGIFDEYTMLNYLEIEAAQPKPARVTNLGVNQVVAEDEHVTVTLAWSTPADAEQVMIRYATTPLTEANWSSAPLLAEVQSGEAQSVSGQIMYTSGVLYFGLKTQNTQGEWSELSNVTYWPAWGFYLPLVKK